MSEPHQPLIAAAEAGDPAEVARLTPLTSTQDQYRAVMHFCERSDAEPINAVRLLLDAGCPVDDETETLHHLTPLHMAAWFGHAQIADALIARGARIEAMDDQYSSTPLQWATMACRIGAKRDGGDYARVIKQLVDLGTIWQSNIYPIGDPEIDAIFEPHIKARFDGVAVHGDDETFAARLAAGPAQDDLDFALLAAAQKGLTNRCAQMLDAGAQVRVVHGWTALHAAAFAHSVELMTLLLDRGADVHLRNVRGGSVWHALAEFGCSPQLIDVVAQRGGLPDINAPSEYGYTPLDLALIEKHEATIAHLQSLGAQPLKETP